MSRTGWLLVGLAALLLLAAGGAAVYVSRKQMADLLRASFARYGLDPEWGPAFGEVESRLNPSARSPAGASDDKLGGAFGSTQITARLLELVGGPSPAALLADPALQAEWTARLVAEGACVKFRADGTPYLKRWGRPGSLEDAAAVWNAGRQTFAELGPSHRTRLKYVPDLLAAYGEPA